MTEATESQIKMAANLYECRDTAKRLFGSAYQKRMDAYGQTIRSAANAMQCSELSAAINLANKHSGVASICFLAAAVEMTEPTNTKAETGRSMT